MGDKRKLEYKLIQLQMPHSAHYLPRVLPLPIYVLYTVGATTSAGIDADNAATTMYADFTF